MPLFFAGHILNTDSLLKTFWAFIAMCFLSTSIYIFNDLIDVDRDRLHPTKKDRPLVTGDITMNSAVFFISAFFLFSLAINTAFLSSEYFAFMQICYFLLMIAYTLWLKHIPIIDSITVSIGFILRVFAGAVLIQLDVSGMLAMTIIGGSLLLSFGKRAAEMHSIKKEQVEKYRPALVGYSVKAIDSIISALVAITFFSYVLLCYDFYTLSLNYRIVALLPPTMRNSQWLMLTVPIAFYGIARYLSLIYTGNQAEKPEELWHKDKPLFITIFIWAVMLFVLIYFRDVLGWIKLLM